MRCKSDGEHEINYKWCTEITCNRKCIFHTSGRENYKCNRMCLVRGSNECRNFRGTVWRMQKLKLRGLYCVALERACQFLRVILSANYITTFRRRLHSNISLCLVIYYVNHFHYFYRGEKMSQLDDKATLPLRMNRALQHRPHFNLRCCREKIERENYGEMSERAYLHFHIWKELRESHAVLFSLTVRAVHGTV